MILIVLFTALQVADVLLTLQIHKRGGRELNPLMRWLMDEYGTLPALVVSKAVLLALAYFYLVGFPSVLIALCAGYAGLAGWNVMQLRKLR